MTSYAHIDEGTGEVLSVVGSDSEPETEDGVAAVDTGDEDIRIGDSYDFDTEEFEKADRPPDLSERVASLETAVDDPDAPSGLAKRIDELEDRVAALEDGS